MANENDPVIITRFSDLKTAKLAPTVWRGGIPPRAGDRVTIELANGHRWCVDCGTATVSWSRLPTGERCQVFMVTYKPVAKIVDVLTGEG